MSALILRSVLSPFAKHDVLGVDLAVCLHSKMKL